MTAVVFIVILAMISVAQRYRVCLPVVRKCETDSVICRYVIVMCSCFSFVLYLDFRCSLLDFALMVNKLALFFAPLGIVLIIS